MPSQDITKIIPRLGSPKVPFLDWKLAIEAYLGKNHQQAYLEYDIRPPVYLKEKETPLGKMSLLIKSATKINATTFDESSSDTPLNLFKLTNYGTVVIVHQDLAVFCEDETKFREARLSYASTISEIRTVLRSSISHDLKHFIDGEKNIYKAYLAIKECYQKDMISQRVIARRELNLLTNKNLDTYLHMFKKKFAEFTMYGGEENREIVETFIYNIPSTYGNSKMNCPNSSLRDAMNFFQEVVEKQKIRFPSQKTESVSINRLQTRKYGNSNSVLRCFKCGGFGHPKSICPTKGDICAKCGKRDHDTKSCKLETLQVKYMQVISYDDELEDTEEDPELQRDYEESDQDESVSLNFLDVFAIDIRNIATRNEIPCTCRFRDKCLHPLLDGGATAHVTGNSQLLKNTVEIKNLKVRGALSTHTINTVSGSIELLLDNNTFLTINEVTYIPSLDQTILSEACLMKDKYDIIKNTSGCKIARNGITVAKIQTLDNHFFIHGTTSFSPRQGINVKNIDLFNLKVANSHLPHFRLGHLNNEYLLKEGLTTNREYCVGCAAAKLHHRPKGNVINEDTTKLFLAKKPLEKLHIDTMGPLPRSHRMFKYVVVIVCSFTGYIYLIFTKEKTNIHVKLIELFKSIQLRQDKKIKMIFTDNGTEFTKIDTYCKSTGISREKSATYFPSANGRVERQNRSLMNMAKAMMYQTSSRKGFWCYAVEYAALILNSMKRKQSLSPYESLHLKKPDLDRIKVFGSRGFAMFDKKKKLEYAKAIIFLGYQPTSDMAYVYEVDKKKVRVTRDFNVDEKGSIESSILKFANAALHASKESDKVEQPGKDEDVSTLLEEDFVNLNEHIHQQISPVSTSIRSKNNPDSPQPPNMEHQDDIATAQAETLTAGPISKVRHYTEISEENIIQSKRPHNIYQISIYMVSSMTDPKSYHQLKFRDDRVLWDQAYQKEIRSLESVGNFKVVERPENIPVIPLVEVFRSKYGLSEEVVHKVRICARGDDKKVEKLLNDETYAPVASNIAFRIFIMMGLTFDLTIRQLDISCAFLYGNLDKDIYLELPQGHKSKVDKSKVWKTRTSIYGLAQSPRVWNEEIDDTLRSQGCTQLESESCLYVKYEGRKDKDKKLVLILLLYVDDILYVGKKEQVEAFEAQIYEKYQLKMNQKASTYIGLQLQFIKDTCQINQVRHITNGAERFKVLDNRPRSTPMDDAEILNSELLEDPKVYQAAVGWLNYLAGSSRPDISYSVSVLSRHNVSPTKATMKRAKNVIRYLFDTKDSFLRYHEVKAENCLKMYTDASFANGPGRKSQYGYIIMLNEDIILYRSKLEPLVTVSSTESEYVAISCAVKEFKWVLKILHELKVNVTERILYCDNQPAIKILRTRGFTGRTKYLDTRYEFVKQELISMDAKVLYVPTDENMADIFTKGLKKVKHQIAKEAMLHQ